MPKGLQSAEHVPEPMIGSFVLESITTGMYGERRNAIREYVQNAYDGIVSARSGKLLGPVQGRITVVVDGPGKSLSIDDDGAGLSEAVAVETLTAIGASRKRRGHDAGFRGIGRLAGVAFCGKLEFRTKAAGERTETTVVFDCDALRKGMLGEKHQHAAKLIAASTTWRQDVSEDLAGHHFKVSLLELEGAPVEATDSLQLRNFLSQVAPVGFRDDFPFKDEIFDKLRAATKDLDPGLAQRIGFEHVEVVVKEGPDDEGVGVRKAYGPEYLAGTKTVPLSMVSVYVGEPSMAWWGWVGHKMQPGAYRDPAVAGIRFRVKNIQIGDAGLIRDVPVENDRRTEWDQRSNLFLGEIYVDSMAVVPNARRDNFEDDDRWLAIRREIAVVCTDLTKEAHDVSEKHQKSVDVIAKKWGRLQPKHLKIVRDASFDMAEASKMISSLDGLQHDVEIASAGAASATVVRLKAISREISQAKTTLLARPKTVEYEQFRSALKAEILGKVFAVLRARLPLSHMDDVIQAVTEAVA